MLYFFSHFNLQPSIDGHVSFSQDYLPPNPPGGENPTFPPKTAVVAPWWSDLDTTSGPGALIVDTYHRYSGSDLFFNVEADVRRYANVNDINLTQVLVFTWKEAEPYPSYVAQHGKEVGDL